MEWHFGYNCKHWLPMPGAKKTLSHLGTGKCRVMVARYNQRADLLALKPQLTMRQFLAYTEWPPDELVARVERGELAAWQVKKAVHPERDGYWRVPWRCSWDWDDCALSESGGHCTFFEPHDGAKIAYLKDMWDLHAQHVRHPNMPSDDDWKLVEERLTAMRDQGLLPGSKTKKTAIQQMSAVQQLWAEPDSAV